MKRNSSFFCVWALLSLSMLLLAMEAWAAEANIKMTESSHGFVSIKMENVLYYRYSAVFTAEADAKLLFKENSLTLTDKTKTRYTQGWLNITSATAGVSFSQQAPIDMRTLLVESEAGQGKAIRWNLSKVAGSGGALEFTIPKGGQVTLDFLWQVPQGFQPRNVTIGKLPEVVLSGGIK